jgi:hypothetical protein
MRLAGWRPRPALSVDRVRRPATMQGAGVPEEFYEMATVIVRPTHLLSALVL